MACPDPNVISELVAGVLPEKEHASVAEHLRACDSCRRVVLELRRVPEGAKIGRYVVDKQIGAGAMGAVYAAYDPELDRKVALKLLHQTGDQTRLVAEGRAMARLAHPHVVPVLDLGESEGRVYVVMELVEGVTLRSWLPRPWREIVAAMIEAGRGLAAAHAVGITHRDFKPENLLVGKDGRLRVTDFGLARSGASPAMAAGVTLTGETAGTPAYMSPEQFRGRSAGAASDQFSFCVVLWEAIYGARPFDDGSEDMEALASAVLAGRVREPPRVGVPKALRRILQRGLSVDPEARFASMEALLAELGKLGRRRRTWIAAALAVVAIAAAGAYEHHRAQLCHFADSSSWTPARRTLVGERFRQSGVAWAAATWPHVEASLDGYARELAGMRRSSCEATELQHTQSHELAWLRGRCLDDREAQLAAFLDVLEHPTPTVVERAAAAAEGLQRVSDCADAHRLTGPLPPRPEVLAEDEALRKRFAVVRARDLAGAVQDARADLTRIIGEAHQIGDRSLEAQALVLRSSREYKDGAQKEALASARAAVTAAEEGRDDRTRAVAWVWQIPLNEPSLPDAQRAAETAKAVLTRVAPDDEVVAQLEVALGIVEQTSGTAKAAREHLEKALSLVEHRYGPDDSKLVEYLSHLITPSMILGDYEGAQRYLDRELRIIEQKRGREHPSYAYAQVSLAALELPRGRPERAIPIVREALAQLERAFGPGAQLLEGLDVLNSALRASGQVRAALPVAQRLFEIGSRAGSQSDDALLGLVTIGGTELDARHFDAAERALDQVVVSGDGPNQRKARVRLARVYLGRHDVARARRSCEAAAKGASPDDQWDWMDLQHCFAEVEEAEGAYAPALARVRKLIAADEANHFSEAPSGTGEDVVAAGRLLQRMGRGEEARAFFERALAGEPGPADPTGGVIDSMVETRLGLARTLPDHERACRLSREAASLLARDEFPRPELAPESRRLLAACN
jgi:tetratricopeptide (TPR) repeat protein/predicted Ser/Thr protein kinase